MEINIETINNSIRFAVGFFSRFDVGYLAFSALTPEDFLMNDIE